MVARWVLGQLSADPPDVDADRTTAGITQHKTP